MGEFEEGEGSRIGTPRTMAIASEIFDTRICKWRRIEIWLWWTDGPSMFYRHAGLRAEDRADIDGSDTGGGARESKVGDDVQTEEHEHLGEFEVWQWEFSPMEEERSDRR